MTRRTKLALTAAASTLAALAVVVVVSNLSTPGMLLGITASYGALALGLRFIKIAPIADDLERATLA